MLRQPAAPAGAGVTGLRRAWSAQPLCTAQPHRPLRRGRRVTAAATQGDELHEGAGAAAAEPQALPRLRASSLHRSGGVLCTDAPVLGTQRARAAKGIRAGGVVYVEAPDGALAPLTARDVRSSIERVRGAVSSLLLPEGGVAAVSPDYWSFTKFNFIRTAVSSAGAVLGTQALLRAIGVGGAAAAAGSAALNWVLKDGLGRCGAIAAASVIGNKFDNDSKTYFLLGDVCYELGVGIELCAPLCPAWFLLIGSLANALKSTSYMMRLPPRAAFLKSFARRENVGDLSAKANAQEVVAGMLGMALGIVLSTAVGSRMGAAFCAYAVTLSAVASCSYASLRGLRLATLNWARMRILLRGYMRSGGKTVPSPAQVNAREPMPSYFKSRRSKKAEWTIPVRFGAPLHQTAPTAAKLRRLAALYANERYLLTIAPGEEDLPRQFPTWRPRRRTAINVSVSEDVTARDALMAMLQAARLQALLQETHVADAEGVTPGLLRDDAYRWDVLERSYRMALDEAPRLELAMQEASWNTGVVLFTPQYVADWSMSVPFPELRCPLPQPPAARAATREELGADALAWPRTAVAEGLEDLDVVASMPPPSKE